MGKSNSLSGGTAASVLREKRNWYIHMCYVRQDFAACLVAIEEQLQATNGLCEYPTFVKGLITKTRGKIHEALSLFQAATCLNPHNIANLKQVARCLFLLGKHKPAIDVYDEAERLDNQDWQVYHNRGVCFLYLKQYDRAEEDFMTANGLGRHDSTFLELGKMYQLQNKLDDALNTYMEALEFSPENPEILTTIGLLYLRKGNSQMAFDHLGNALTQLPKNSKTILALGSILQDNGDMDVALVKYRVAAVVTPNSAQLWNNVGMCFFGKGKYVAAVACLKRAFYLMPFEWIISYNLGLIYLNTGQYASAFHYISSAINLRPKFATAYMYLGVALSKLGDLDNARGAYERSLQLEDAPLAHLNFAITLFNRGEVEEARRHFEAFEQAMDETDTEVEADEDVIIARNVLRQSLSLSAI